MTGRARESVWDYPRPPRLEPVTERLRVVFAGHVLADTVRGHRVLETSHPPVYYIPPEDVDMGLLVEERGQSFCEFKGRARYFGISAEDRRARRAAWCYPEPTPAFAAIAGHLAFYAGRVDEAWVGADRVSAQEGDFYGGWITPEIEGPFKGAPGTWFW
jgi:uncharacterized protein (DUF427 family)